MRRIVDFGGAAPALLGLLLSSGCDAPPAMVEAEAHVEVPEPPTMASYTVAAADFDLAATMALVEREDVKSAAELEVIINAEDSPIVVDVDRDGVRDFIQVYEVGAPAQGHATFEFRAVAPPLPSVSASASASIAAEPHFVTLATAEFSLDAATQVVTIEGRYAPVVVDVQPEVTIVRRVEHTVIVGAPFFAWLWVDVRPVYVGHVHLPPGHAKKLGLGWKVHHHHHGVGPGLHMDMGHRGHAKVKHKGHGGHAKFKAKGHAPHGKVSIKAKHHAPSFKAKASFGAGGGSKRSAKGGGGGKSGGKGKGGKS